MATMGTMRVDAMDIASNFTMHVRITGVKRLAFRTQIARWLMALAARVVQMDLWIIHSE